MQLLLTTSNFPLSEFCEHACTWSSPTPSTLPGPARPCQYTPWARDRSRLTSNVNMASKSDSGPHMSQSCCAENLGDGGPPASPTYSAHGGTSARHAPARVWFSRRTAPSVMMSSPSPTNGAQDLHENLHVLEMQHSWVIKSKWTELNWTQEYFCPVTLELLHDPKQTECCGHHLSAEVVSRLQREGKSCPLCNDPNFTVSNDKYFKRKVKELRVRCSHRRSGCEWVGELGDLDLHSNSA